MKDVEDQKKHLRDGTILNLKILNYPLTCLMNLRINNISILLLTALYVPMLFLGLFDLDEGAFAATSFQMLENNKFLVPMIGEELRLEKPVLTYWIQALSIKIWGANEFALRLPAVLASFFWAYSFSNFIKETDSQASSSEIYVNLLTLPGVFIISFAATADAFLNLFITLLMIEIYRYSKNHKDIHLVKSALFVAIGFLLKGLTIIAIGGMVALLYFAYQRRLSSFFKLTFSIKAWSIFLLVIAPWFLLLANKIGVNELSYLFFEQTFGRFTNTFEKHDGPVYYYLIIFIFLALPYLVDVVRGMMKLNLRRNELDIFLFIWFIFVFIFFSFSSTKLPHYLIYGITPIAYFVYKNHQQIKSYKLTASSSIFFILIWLSILALPFYLSYLAGVRESLEVSGSTLTKLTEDISYLIFSVSMLLFFVIGSLTKLNLLLVKRVSSLALIAILSLKIIPIINESTQADIKKLGLIASKLEGDVTMYKLNKPSFGFYANKISYRGLERADIILTRKDKIDSLNINFEIISISGNYLLLRKEYDNK